MASPARPLTSLTRRDAALGIAALATTSTLASCGGGGGGGGAAAAAGAPAGTAPTVTATFSAAGFTTSNDSSFGFLSTTQSRDQEVTTWMRRGRVYLRITPAGRALFFDVTDASLTIGIALGISQTAYYPADQRILGNGITLPTGSTFTFGVQGFDIYVKVDGVESYRIQDFHHVDVGQVGLKQPNGYAFSTISGSHFADKQLLSNLVTQTYDVRDFGFRSVRTTGSITASGGARTTLTLASPADIRVGDFVIVEIGKEPGAGLRGTVGVGGTWPALSYASSAARGVDISQAPSTYAWDRDTGDVYQWSGSAWVRPTKYYFAKAVPRSLHARVTSVSGTTLILDAPAALSVTNANVYLDVIPFINFLTQHTWYKFGGARGELQSLIAQERTILLPEGDFPIGGAILLNRGGSRTALRGAGRDKTILRSPNGAACGTIYSTQVSNLAQRTIVQDLHLVGNARNQGFGLNWRRSVVPYGYGNEGMEWDFESPGPPVTETNLPQGSAYAYGILTHGSNKVDVRDVNVTDVFMAGVGAFFTTDCNVYNATIKMTDGLQSYVQWMILWADSVGGSIVDCGVESPTLIGGIETFRSSNVQIIRPVMINATFSSNSSGGFLFQDAVVTIRSMSQGTLESFSQYNPIFNINSNIAINALMSLGGRLVNCRVEQQGYINAAGDSLFAIVVNRECPNIAVSGGYLAAPDFMNTSALGGAVGVNSTGTNTTVTGLTVVGKSKYDVTGSSYRNINVANGSVTGCTCNSILVG